MDKILEKLLELLSLNYVVITICVVVLILLSLFVIGFLQGREISFWHPRIGQRPAKNKQEKKGSEIPNIDSEFEKEDGEYVEPSRLVVFKHSEVDANMKYTLDIMTVSTVISLVDGNISMKKIGHSTNIIKDIQSVSHPINSNIKGKSSSDLEISTQLNGVKKGQQYIYVTSNTRELRIGGERKWPEQSYTRMFTLYSRYLSTEYHHAVGTGTNVAIGHLRFLLYFPKKFLPRRVMSVQIGDDGGITENIMRQELVENEGLWIFESDSIPKNCGVYICWVWSVEDKEA